MAHRRRAPLVAALGTAVLLWLAAGPGAHAESEQAPPAVPVHPSLEPLKPWLTHADWTVRSIAGFELRSRTAPGTVHLAARMLAAEKEPYAAAGTLGALRGRPRRELVMEGGPLLAEALLRWTRCHHPTIAGYAREVLAIMPPIKLGDSLRLLEGWWKRGRAALDREQRALLAESAKKPAAKDEKKVAKSTSVESGGSSKKEDDRFYGRLEDMRRFGLELVIVMDHTGSMGPVIGAAKAGARRLLRRLQAYVPRFRAGLVTYDDGARVRATLTSDAAILEKKLSKVGAGGGGDLEEGVDKGIRAALSQERLGWSQRAYRVIVVVGDAPPHEPDVRGLHRLLRKARDDVMYDKPVVVHTVSTAFQPVDHFESIARSGGGQHVLLRQTGRLVEELVMLTFGGGDRKRIRAWMDEIDKLRAAEPKRPGR